jgi:secreted Zn-dependent insulinase-like peptidase
LSRAQSYLSRDFEQGRAAVLHELEQPPRSQAEWGRKYWGSILAKDEGFDETLRLIAAVKAATPETLEIFYRAIVTGDNGHLIFVGGDASIKAEDLSPNIILINDYGQFKQALPAYVYP